MNTRPFEAGEIEALIALHNRIGPGGRQWSRLEAEALLLDQARGGGSQVAVAEDAGQIVGFAGWVALGEGEFYGSPVIAATRAAADKLVARLEAEAIILGARFIRISVFEEETPKRAALEEAGFEPAIELVYLVRALDPAVTEVRVPDRYTRVAPAEIDLERFVELHNESFAEVDNSPPVTLEIAADAWDPVHMLVSANQLWRDASGRYVGFSTVHREGHLESIGVADHARGTGLGKALMQATLAATAAAGLTQLESCVASSNPASLGLHHRFGFVERARATALQLDLTEDEDEDEDV
jgi:ribosomal protein S18 acetylase RimI-like enzyme